IKAYDGLTAALVNDGQLIVTSPNSKTIPHPPLGGDRPVYLRDNLRYADDDPLLWPQPFMENLPHLPLIRVPSKSENDPLHVIWWQPTIQEFVVDPSVLLGLGRLDPSCVARLRLACMPRVEQARRSEYQSMTLLQEHVTTILALLDRLTHLSMSFERARLCVREVQRAYLELWALIDWRDVFQPRVTGRIVHTGEIAGVVGCFTYNIGTCEDLYRAGIPVYLIRDFTTLHTMRIKTVITPIIPDETITSNLNVRYSTIYTGAATSSDKYRAIRRFTHFFHGFANPFNKHRVPLPRLPPEPTTSISNSQARALRYTPYARRTKKKADFYAAQGRNKFEDPIDPILPPSIPAWRDALLQIDQSKPNFADSDVLGSDFGYAFPEPASFIAFEKRERRNVALCSWLRYRNAFIYRLLSEQFEGRPMSGKAWRDILSLDWLERPSSTDKQPCKTDSEKISKNSSRLQRLTDFLESCLRTDGLTLNEIERGRESWNGKPFAALEDKDLEEILWELAELNFRQEFLALDLRIHGSDPDFIRQRRISGCFPGQQLLPIPLSEANHGIASYDEEERCRYLLEMQRVVRDWPGEKAEILKVDSLRWRSRDIEDLETAVACFYTQTFFDYFRRAPIVPRRLSHTIPGFTSPPPLLEYLNPAPKMYYDVTQLL
ncbi:hypothetical protein C0992_002164, partial [Termitomyces sp. T32_za158]